MKTTTMFDARVGADGSVRSGVWDRICVPGHDAKDGQQTEFTSETLSQMVDNFTDRGDLIPLDHNHQSNYASINGQPAPALAFYGAFAVVENGKVIKLGKAQGVEPSGLEGMDGRDGLWGFRSEVTKLGQELLPNYRLLSPTFLVDGTRRDGTPCGYCLMAVAATNTPWQAETKISFSRPTAVGLTDKGNSPMNLKKLASFMSSKFGAKFEAGADEDAKKVSEQAKQCMASTATEAFSAEKYDYAAGATALEEMAKLYEDSQIEPDGDEEAPQATMRKMAAKFRRMAAPAKDASEMDVDPGNWAQNAAVHLKTGNVHDEYQRMEKFAADLGSFAKSMGIESQGKSVAQIMDCLRAVTVPAAKVAEAAKVAAQSAIEEDREKRAAADRKARAARLMEQLPASYPGDREALRRLAENDPDEASKLASPFMGSPAYLFDRHTSNGSPIGKMSREETTMAPTKTIRTPFGQFVVEDDAFAAEIERVAFSKDPVLMGRVDALVRPHEREQKAARLIAAEKLVRRERPDLSAGE